MFRTRAPRRVAAALPFAALLAAAPFAFGDDLPSLIDERDPTRAEGLREAIDVPGDKPGAEVTLPDTQQGLSRETPVTVTHVRFVGGTVFPLEELSADFQPMIGEDVPLGEIADAVQRITARYQQAGYPLSYAYMPGNDLTDGTLVIVVVEGYIARTEIEVDNEAVAARIEALAEPLFAERPLTRASFERATLLMERIPGAKFAMRAPVPKTANGATTLRVEEREIDRFSTGGSLEGGDEDDYLLLVNGAMRGFTPFAEELSAAAILPTGDDRYYAAEYAQDIGTDGLRLRLGVNRFEGESDDTILLLGQNIRVREDKIRTRFSAGLSYPLILARQERWMLETRLQHHDEDADYTYSLMGQPFAQATQQLRYTAADLSSAYQRVTMTRLYEIRGEVRQGFDPGNTNRNRITIGNTVTDAPERTEFTRLASQGRWVEQFLPRWRITARADGFWSPDRLPQPEQGNYGGRRFARAYPDGQGEGDYGYAGDIELRYIQPLGFTWLTSIEPYVLVDGAHTGFNDLDLEHNLASGVIGFDISNGKNYRLGLEYAYPFGDEDIETGDRDGRINVRVSWNFSS
ncbi:ShlB/FhaC/HecB family hemolysin secretion/activation protein [Tepidicaulis sp. LMO-SS28]|uniref:ShlB/FhaC/HecB family hemolysin secretion/activation protein n=1 Tax=Tepidicaulis sp. LMO-SS28 TaxID=3447455 RepID=UPI003EDEE391